MRPEYDNAAEPNLNRSEKINEVKLGSYTLVEINNDGCSAQIR